MREMYFGGNSERVAVLESIGSGVYARGLRIFQGVVCEREFRCFAGLAGTGD